MELSNLTYSEFYRSIGVAKLSYTTGRAIARPVCFSQYLSQGLDDVPLMILQSWFIVVTCRGWGVPLFFVAKVTQKTKIRHRWQKTTKKEVRPFTLSRSPMLCNVWIKKEASRLRCFLCWATRTRTLNDRTRICSVTITPSVNSQLRCKGSTFFSKTNIFVDFF